ncbi:MAG: protein translocase subunit SecF [Micavibrio sp.]|nr:protein translocase subunit SecF [Micavibrio sp.]
MRGIKFLPEVTNVNFTGVRVIAFVISLSLIIASLSLVVTRGLNFGIDFTGGTIIEVRTPEIPNLGELRSQLNDLGLGAISIQEFGQPDDLLIRLPQQDGDALAQTAAIDKVRASLDTHYDGGVEYRRTEFVGPQVGEELKRQGLLAIIFSLIGIMGYIWLRFEWQFGIAALIALAHDATITVGFFAFTQMEFNLSTVAALLMIAGYSINDTVVVFDRIREDLRKYKKKPLAELFNMSINETLSRTTMTSLTTLLALFALYYFGGEVIRGFVDALMFGVVVGTYSSIFVASPLLMYFDIRRDAEKEGETPQSA